MTIWGPCFRVCRRRRRRFLTGNSDKSISEFMGHCEYLRSKELKKLGYLVHFHRREKKFPSHSAFFRFSEALWRGLSGSWPSDPPSPGEGLCGSRWSPELKKSQKIENFRFFSKVPKSPKMHSNEVFMCF